MWTSDPIAPYEHMGTGVLFQGRRIPASVQTGLLHETSYIRKNTRGSGLGSVAGKTRISRFDAPEGPKQFPPRNNQYLASFSHVYIQVLHSVVQLALDAASLFKEALSLEVSWCPACDVCVSMNVETKPCLLQENSSSPLFLFSLAFSHGLKRVQWFQHRTHLIHNNVA